MSTAPFVNFRMTPTLNVGSTPTIIFGNDLSTCLLDGIVLSNMTEGTLLVTLWIAREITIGTETDFIFANKIPIQQNDKIDVLLNATLTLEAGDLLYAASDYTNNLFNAFVSYRELTELSGMRHHVRQ